MAFLISPGVQVKEFDFTNSIPATATSIGGFVGAFNTGPVNEITQITSEKELADLFGKPTDATARSFLTAASFLKYSSNLKVIRALGKSGSTTFLNATSGYLGSRGLLIKNRDHYEANYAEGAAAVGMFAAKYPGTLGNSLTVSVCPANSTAFTAWTYKSEFASLPSSSITALAGGSSNDELHVIVIDTTGLISGAPGTILEKFEYLSQAADSLKADGTSNYYKQVINTTSKFIWWLDHDLAFTNAGASAYSATTFVTGTAALTYTMAGGTDLAVLKAEVLAGLDLFADAETVDVNLLFTAGDASGDNDVANYQIAIAEARKDVVTFVSPPIESTATSLTPSADVITWANLLTSSSYAVIDSTALKVYDKYNDVYRWIPASGHIAGLCANAEEVADAWWSPAGYNRGQLLGVTKLAFNPKLAERDSLYKARVNPLVAFPGAGIMLFGDKTALAKPSAFDRINVCRLFIVLEKAIATAAKFQLFEFNDEFTQAMFRNMTEPFLRDIKGRRGITDFLVVCDGTNNTGEVVDRNEFVASIYIKPARSINFITLNFVATRTGVAFSEIAGK